jgi:hypothetical protein
MNIIKKPNFFLVGAPKCGTTAMAQYLAKHPNIFMPIKELHFFGSDLNFSPTVDKFSSPRDKREVKKYLSFFDPVTEEKMIGESSVWYLYSKTASSEIKAFSPQSKIIIMLRNPVDMLYSLHSQHLWDGNEFIENFEEALSAEYERKKGRYIPDTVHFVSALFYSDIIKFTEQIESYFNTFGKNNVHIILFDEFKNNTLAVYKETLRFLGVKDDITPIFNIVNPNKKIRNKRLHKLLRDPLNPFRKIGRVMIPKQVRTFLFIIIEKYNTKFIPRPSMNPETKKKLKKLLEAEIIKLGTLLEKDLTYWNI